MTKLEQGIQFMQEQNWEEAARLLTEYIDENPADGLGYVNFGNLLDVLGEQERAVTFFINGLLN
ncbi:hypothetical protein GCM10020331_036040 [Ectobacillus funiculus]